jgi:hypothetical protein
MKTAGLPASPHSSNQAQTFSALSPTRGCFEGNGEETAYFAKRTNGAGQRKDEYRSNGCFRRNVKIERGARAPR